MSVASPSDPIPCADGVENFFADAFSFLANARRQFGDLFALPVGPVFSRARDVNGVVCVFGEEFQREVLSDIDIFAMPESAARLLKLPETLVNLNRGLHSMTDPEHDVQKRILAQMLSSAGPGPMEEPVAEWKLATGAAFPLVSEMRSLVLGLATRVMFGRESGSRIGELVYEYFQLRRDATSPGRVAEAATIDAIETRGAAVDAVLRSYLREGAADGDGIFAKLASLVRAGDGSMTEDEAVGHMNVLFISSTEPLAVALSWTLLILSQLPRLTLALREEVKAANGRLEGMALMNGVLQESLRLLPPNAFMVRLTSEPVRLGKFTLPAHCEVILCPFLSHRDSTAFADPTRFRPERWTDQPPPSPWMYFPFGAGGHACVGRIVAMRLLKTVLAFLLPRFDLVLLGDQEVDWRLHVQFMPACDPIMAAFPAGSSGALRAGMLGGPAGSLMDLTGMWKDKD